jgi:hypothetical protein
MWTSKLSLQFTMVVILAGGSVLAKEIHPVVIYDDVATRLDGADEKLDQLWITAADLTRATRFELKPQGVCRDELCFPLPKSERAQFVRNASGKTWLNITAFARLVRQPVANDAALATWYFGLRADQQQELTSLEAPNFVLPDLDGKLHSLSDFRGKKVLLVTWASW